MSNVIKKLVLDLGDKEITLTLEQAKKLHEALNELFSKKVVTEKHHHYEPIPWYPWRWQTATPIWLSTNGTSWRYSQNTLTCQVKS